ncbi:MAG: trimethylamine methyltransferase family protein, partial [Pseudomonadota bacterium]|nr:trimethylamine methyltransferase family protein [Pseudomonadota bacterium]
MADSPPDTRQRRRRRAQPDAAPAAVLAPVGGRLALLDEDELDLIHDTALAILADTGLADPTDEATNLVLGAGGSLSPDGRLLFPPALVERVIDSLPGRITLCGRRSGTDLVLGGTAVHLGSGGASPQILDLDKGRYRDSVLTDIHDAAR